MRLTWLTALAAAFSLTAGSGHAAVDLGLVSAIALPGPEPSWDYLTYDAAHDRLFVGRRKAGVTVVDPTAGRVLGQVERSEGANIALLVSALGRGFTANGDGTTTIFDLSSLRALDRIKLGEAVDSAFYEPVTRQVVFTLGDSRELVFLDAAAAQVTARVPMDAQELEAVASDGQGVVFVNERDRDRIARVDAHSHKVTSVWTIPGCHMPAGLAIDRQSRRLFIGCRGEHPVLAVMDAASGKVLATCEIGRGNDGVAYDPVARRIYTSNGVEGNVVVLDRPTPDTCRLAGAFTTRPLARTMALDMDRGRLFTATAEGLVDPALPVNRRAGAFYPNRYADDTFAVLVYAPRAAAIR